MKPLAAILIATMTISNCLAETQKVIVETQFTEADATGLPLAADAPADAGDLPLRMPTNVGEAPDAASSPSQARIGKEDFGRLKPPYLVLQVGQSLDSPSAIANVGVAWDLQKLSISGGRYEISFDVSACQNDKVGAIFSLNFQSQTPNFGAGINPNMRPGLIRFLGNGQMLICGTTQEGSGQTSYEANEIKHCVLRIDLDKRIWSVEVNGESQFEGQKWPDYIQAAAAGDITLSGLSFGSERGLGCEPNSRFILANVKVIKLTN